MILDTTYLLPLSRIGIDTDLLKAIENGKTRLNLDNITVSMISLFELQAKAAKLNVPASFTAEAIEVITSAFKVQPFYVLEIVERSQMLLKQLNDYIDCIVVATAIVLEEDLITEDSRIRKNWSFIKDRYSINVTNYKEILEGKYPP